MTPMNFLNARSRFVEGDPPVAEPSIDGPQNELESNNAATSPTNRPKLSTADLEKMTQMPTADMGKTTQMLAALGTSAVATRPFGPRPSSGPGSPCPQASLGGLPAATSSCTQRRLKNDSPLATLPFSLTHTRESIMTEMELSPLSPWTSGTLPLCPMSIRPIPTNPYPSRDPHLRPNEAGCPGPRTLDLVLGCLLPCATPPLFGGFRTANFPQTWSPRLFFSPPPFPGGSHAADYVRR